MASWKVFGWILLAYRIFPTRLVEPVAFSAMYFIDYSAPMRKIESSTFTAWLRKLKDDTGKARIVSRINRLAEGLSGDVTGVGHGVSELRIHYGPGYRVYFHRRGDMFLILLCGGDKGSQTRDIETAHTILRLWGTQHD